MANDRKLSEVDHILLLEDKKKIINWYYNGMGLIGGSLSMFIGLPLSRIEELYNVKF